MARFDVYELGGGSLVVDVQSDLLPPMATRIVIPLAPATVAPRVFEGLNPRLVVDGETYTLITQQMSAVSSNALHRRVLSLSKEADQIARAIDYVLYGF